MERQRGNPAYAPYKDAAVFCHQMNVYEFVASLVRDMDETRARRELALMEPNLVEATQDDIFVAVALWKAHRAKRISYIDALGYTLSQRHGMRFLTGDTAFKGMEGVEHVV